MSRPRNLDFIVIGAAKAATTTLWQGLASHPQLCLPGDKERGFFNSERRYGHGLDAYIAEVFAHAWPGQLLGTVTPMYMASDGLEQVVARMQETSPEARLIAILRDPIERAVSRFRHNLRRGLARGASLDEHLDDPDRRGEDVVADGEYGRILSVYLSAFPRHQLQILFTEDFARWPGPCYQGIFDYLGVDRAHLPPQDLRLNPGGTRPRVDEPELEQLLDRLNAEVWPHVADRREAQRALEWWLRHVWNVEPDEEGRDVSPALARRLREHYLADAQRLRQATGVAAPWVARYAAANAGHSATSSDGQVAHSRATSGR
jgi:hypothetical protein